ncbi:hypothetical protein A2U01_0108349, partial [Trifolium medium]|nr:hypothetical protein [Trifolium medium]
MKMVTTFQYSRNDKGKNARNSRGKHRWIGLNNLPSSPAMISQPDNCSQENQRNSTTT